MFRVTALVVALILATASSALAERPGPLGKALSTTSVRRALPPTPPGGSGPAQTPPTKKASHPVRNGALIGAGIGLVLGIVAVTNAGECPPGRSCSTAGAGAPVAMIYGAGIGAIVGLILR